ncbi:MAG: DUF5658 family protein [bacterium]|nr:DUF5658 family protein [bacterium]
MGLAKTLDLFTAGKANYISTSVPQGPQFVAKGWRYCRSLLLSRNQLKLVAVTLIFFQLLDGALTAIGLKTYGIEAEGNPVLVYFMKEFGLFLPLVVAKSLASLAVAILYLARNLVTWVPLALISLTCVYYFAAIVPWVLTLTY